VNEEIKKAKDTFDQRPKRGADWEKATEEGLKQLMQAASVKEEVLSLLPGIDVKPGVVLPVEPVFATFSDLDIEMNKLVIGTIYQTYEEDDWRKALSKIRVLLDEIKTNLLGRYKPADPAAAQDIEDLSTFVGDLEELIKSGFGHGGSEIDFWDEYWKKLGLLYDNIKEAKKSFLNRFASPLPLRTVYQILYQINWGLHCAHWIESLALPDEFTSEYLQLLLDLKHELEVLVARTPATGN
jgi:hypothetical protein